MRVAPLFLLVALTAGPLAAQETNPLNLTVGDQIRLHEPTTAANGTEGYVTARGGAEGGWVNGQVTMLEADGFSFTVPGDPQVYTRPYVSIDMIDIKRQARRQSMVSGALWGAYLGAALGAISGPFAAKSMPIGTGPSMAVFGAAGGVGGAALGAAVSAILLPTRWYRYVLR